MTPLTTLSDDERLFFDTILGFARERVGPKVSSMDEEGALEPSLVRAVRARRDGRRNPERARGSESSFFNAILAVEAIAQVNPSVAVVVDVQNTLVNSALLRWGNAEQKAKYLPSSRRSGSARTRSASAGSGSDAFALKTRAERRGDGWVLTGRKLWITNAAESSLFIVFANVDPGQGYKGITAFLVERGFSGFSVGKKEDKLGIRASNTCGLVLDECEVPAANVLGQRPGPRGWIA